MQTVVLSFCFWPVFFLTGLGLYEKQEDVCVPLLCVFALFALTIKSVG